MNLVNAGNGLRMFVIAATLAAALAGCQSGYRGDAAKTADLVMQGKYSAASEFANSRAEKKVEDKDEIDQAIYMLEAGRCAQLAGYEELSERWYSGVSDLIDPFLNEQAEAKISEGLVTTGVNQTLATYRGRMPERPLLETMRAVNLLVTGDAAAARIRLNKAFEWQQEAVQRNAARIEKELDEAEKQERELGVPAKQAGADVLTRTEFANLSNMKPYADFADPFTVYLRGVFLLIQGDTEDSVFQFKRVVSMHGEDPVLAAEIAGDLDLAKDRGAMRRIAPQTWIVLFEGLVPELKEFRLDIPIPVGDVNYVSAAFPYLVDRPVAVAEATAESSSGRRPLVLISDFSRMMKADFNERLPTIIFQEILSAAAKAAATYAAKEGIGGWGQVAGIVYQAFSTAADLRGWRTLPSRVMAVRMSTPADGAIALHANGARVCDISVVPGSSNLVFVSVPSAVSAPSVRIATLVPAPEPPASGVAPAVSPAIPTGAEAIPSATGASAAASAAPSKAEATEGPKPAPKRPPLFAPEKP